jgi:hypothetical protein
MSRACTLLLLLVCCFASLAWRVTPPIPTSEPPLFRLTLAGPIAQKSIPLTHALAQLGWHAQGGYVLFGVEVRLIGGREPTVNLEAPAGITVGAALRQVLQQLPSYRTKVVSQHLINIYPAGAWADPVDALNLRINQFDVSSRPPDVIMNLPTMFMPSLAEYLAQRKTGPPLPVEPPSEWIESVGPKVTLHLRNMTVREILNRVSEASENLPARYLPGGWVASLRPDPALATGWAYSFRWFPTVPSTWKQQKPKAKNRALGSAPAQ